MSAHCFFFFLSFSPNWQKKKDYHVFDDYKISLSPAGHIEYLCNIDYNSLQVQTLPTFVGEWSLAWKVPSGPSLFEPFPTYDVNWLTHWGIAQQYIYEQHPLGSGWFYWTLKCENTSYYWDLNLALEYKVSFFLFWLF
jgi:hypothetical protein